MQPDTFPADDAPTTGQTTLDGLLAGLMNRAPGTVRVLLASGDGLKLAHTDKDVDKADEMAAVMSGLYSLGRGIFKHTPGGVRQVVVEHDGGRLFVMSAACLRPRTPAWWGPSWAYWRCPRPNRAWWDTR